MKRIIYILVMVVVSGLTVTSCTEENVTPTQENGGGAGNDPILKD